MIKKNNLGFSGNLFVYQDKNMFSYSVDTIMLGNFFSINRNVSNILEVGTNNGALSIFIALRCKEITIDALEIQHDAVTLAQKNVKFNKLENQINVIEGDFNVYVKEYAFKCGNKLAKKYSAIIANPPYYNENYNVDRKNTTYAKKLATHEITLTLEQLVENSSKIIEQKGYLTLVLPMARYIDIICLLRKYNFEPKRIQLIYTRVNEIPKFCMIESRFNSGWGTKFEKNLYLHYDDIHNHEYTEEVKKLYSPIKVEKRK